MREEDGVGEAQVPPPNGHESVADLIPIVRRVVAARVRDPTQVDDLVQETLSRVMSARFRVEGDSLVPYAVVTARNLIVSAAQREQRAGRTAHLLAEPDDPQPRPEDEALREADAALVHRALGRLPEADRQLLLAHEVEGRDTAALAADRAGPTVVVSNEVGMGVHPETALGMRYRDLLGRVNQHWAAAADTSLLLVAGRAVALTDPWMVLT